ncbi:creatininase family protein [Natranaeroarchaeum sulfidigenes]|uniref:Creatinine amidohydrolase/Fe(II)-dependent formamide hydrolase involved in riboflavin and F420 biosynthesis n=1 Tax=Natranaeroarchaeum sulfidigenes TaxID=2784880 RepID=A0A897MPK2_9EURY|nr:creatininase family protein [Natranaeroarchaeum sulfidigenes]QSG02487.1 Creatinine amidohydrolase/Fe(II)-dependent formamide hydrolase involved in riboflavin and F420 biosynthesis [Natranaeroarchaeum sulfidigenes]
MQLADRPWPDIQTYCNSDSLAIVPLGSTEQHGPHLPEGTDHLIADALAREAAERTGFLCTPPVMVGVSSHHRQFHGTLSVDPATFRDYVESLSRSLTGHGIDRIVYVNAHGGNVEHLREVGRRLYEDDTAYAIEWMWNESIPDLVDDLFEHTGPHGGPKETAMILHIAPELVREDRLDAAAENGVARMEELQLRRHGARTFYDAIENSDNGVFGDQRDATAAKGEQLFEAAVDQLTALLDWLDEQRYEDLTARPHV